MTNLSRLGGNFSIPIPSDEDGFTGRECPETECEGYFKIECGTGLKGENLPCYCPYCGYSGPHDKFWTKEQIKYAKSVAMRKITKAIHKDFKKLEFEHKPRGAFGIGISMKFKPGRPIPIYRYQEKELETEIICENCTLRYAVYGIFAYCPDCGIHNSLQILLTDFEVIKKQIVLAESQEAPLAEILIEDALENCVSKFDGFGRNHCRSHKRKAKEPAKAENISFQNISGAKGKLKKLFGVDITAGLAAEDWDHVVLCFQKRHVFEHNKGVIDQAYVDKSGDPSAVVSRKLEIASSEVEELVTILDRMANHINNKI